MPDFRHEQASGCARVCGVDEVGRGPLAGPVVAAAVILDRGRLPAELAACIDDSKLLSRAQRQHVADALPEWARIGIGQADVAEIERLNIYWASLLAMRRAVAALDVVPEMVLVDGNRAPDGLPCAARAIIDGDALSLSIAAASIVAKVTRDRLMTLLGEQYPGYGFERNAGYGTAEHRAALLRLGASPVHRHSFPSVQAILSQLSLALPEPLQPHATTL